MDLDDFLDFRLFLQNVIKHNFLFHTPCDGAVKLPDSLAAGSTRACFHVVHNFSCVGREDKPSEDPPKLALAGEQRVACLEKTSSQCVKADPFKLQRASMEQSTAHHYVDLSKLARPWNRPSQHDNLSSHGRIHTVHVGQRVACHTSNAHILILDLRLSIEQNDVISTQPPCSIHDKQGRANTYQKWISNIHGTRTTVTYQA